MLVLNGTALTFSPTANMYPNFIQANKNVSRGTKCTIGFDSRGCQRLLGFLYQVRNTTRLVWKLFLPHVNPSPKFSKRHVEISRYSP